jgi:hypothetical protein
MWRGRIRVLVSVFFWWLFVVVLSLVLLLVLSLVLFRIKIEDIKIRPQQLQRRGAVVIGHDLYFSLWYPPQDCCTP